MPIDPKSYKEIKKKPKKHPIDKKADDAVGRVVKPKSNAKTPSYSSEEVQRLQSPGYYKDPKTGKRKQFKKQYKA
jgi:hypothetical protein